MSNNLPDRHLDLGCGLKPRNPYGRRELIGVDVHPDSTTANKGFTVVVANIAVDPLPFADNHFQSVSAYDVLEHIPRQIYRADHHQMFNPFVNLMSEIWRVLVPGGRLVALTPAYPHAAAFVDPTHVNFITKDTHLYFCGERTAASTYGFKGRFNAVRVGFTAPPNVNTLPDVRWRSALRNVHRQLFRGGVQHLLWELEAVK